MGEFKRPSVGVKQESVDSLEPYFKRPSIGVQSQILEVIEPYFKRPSIGLFHDNTYSLSMTAIIDNITGVMITSRYE